MDINQINQRVYNLVSKIPKGKVTTYGKISISLGLKSPRQVGRILHNNPDPKNIPCHRVVFSSGKLTESFAFGGIEVQKEKLIQEGILFVKDKVDMKNFCI